MEDDIFFRGGKNGDNRPIPDENAHHLQAYYFIMDAEKWQNTPFTVTVKLTEAYKNAYPNFTMKVYIRDIIRLPKRPRHPQSWRSSRPQAGSRIIR